MHSISLHFARSFPRERPSPSCQQRLQNLRLHTKRRVRAAPHGHCAAEPARRSGLSAHACPCAHTWEGGEREGLASPARSPLCTPSWVREGGTACGEGPELAPESG